MFIFQTKQKSTSPNQTQTQPHQTKPNSTIPNQTHAYQTEFNYTKPNSSTPNQTHPPYQSELNHTKPNSSIPNQIKPTQTKPDNSQPNLTNPNWLGMNNRTISSLCLLLTILFALVILENLIWNELLNQFCGLRDSRTELSYPKNIFQSFSLFFAICSRATKGDFSDGFYTTQLLVPAAGEQIQSFVNSTCWKLVISRWREKN